MTLPLLAALSVASAATQGQRDASAPVYADGQYLGEAFAVDGELWISAAALDASVGDAIVTDGTSLKAAADVQCGTGMLGISAGAAISADLVSFRDLGLKKKSYLDAVEAFEGYLVGDKPLEVSHSCPAGKVDYMDDSCYDPYGGALVPLADVASALGAEIESEKGGEVILSPIPE